MQYKNEKTLLLAKIIGETIKTLRIEKAEVSINKFAHEYDLDVGNISRIEKGLTDVKTVTLWKICEALDIEFSDFIKIVQDKMGSDFKIIDD